MKEYGYARTSTPKQKLERQIYNIKEQHPTATIFSEAYTGTKIDRPEFSKLLKIVNAGDTIVFDEVSRMSRNAQDGFKLYQELYSKGVNLVFLKEHYLDTEVFDKALKKAQEEQTKVDTGNKANDAFMNGILELFTKWQMDIARQQIEIAFNQSQAEVDHLHQRTADGIARARANGKQIGRNTGDSPTLQKEAPAKAIIRQYSKDFDGSNSDSEVMAILATKTYSHTTQNGQTTQKPLKLARNTYYKYKAEMKAE